jgi:hypothetical protein
MPASASVDVYLVCLIGKSIDEVNADTLQKLHVLQEYSLIESAGSGSTHGHSDQAGRATGSQGSASSVHHAHTHASTHGAYYSTSSGAGGQLELQRMGKATHSVLHQKPSKN